MQRSPAIRRLTPESDYELTGPQAFTGAAFAEELGAAAGHTVRYVDVPDDGMRASLLQNGIDEWTADGILDLCRRVRRGGAATLTGDVRTTSA